MKKIALTICILLSTLSITAQNTISGVWNMGKANTKLEIKGSEGKVLSSDKLEEGKLMLKEVTPHEDHWEGKLYIIKKKKWLDAKLKVKGNQLLVVIDVGFTTKTLKWSKE